MVQDDAIETREGFDRHNELNLLVVHGRLVCAGEVQLEFHEAFRARGGRANRIEIRGIDLGYHAWIPGLANRDVLRYDDAHGPLHRHIFDQRGAETGRVQCELEELPTMSQLVEMALEIAGIRA